MKRVSEEPKISLQEAEKHYEQSGENYIIDSGESHLAYYRDKYPKHYQMLLNNV
ncbi:hypothetical protein [Arenibacter sp. F20364]|uniref:hypothetical protein n=1 Tax=Arenibacter sp. F20364 TaxID=2926415 RepID=UPI001FF5B3E0|nr:hypothetical protein [Arenibacter sp. F20364]MCK0192765.1 hypothetical protein [Arenibacter sp. F20364]